MFARYLRLITAAVLLCFLSLRTSPARATITVGGDGGEVSPSNPAIWTSSTTAQIGVHSGKTGTVTAAGGSSLLSSYAYLGFNAGSTGSVVVTGAGTKWTNSSDLNMGLGGTGILRVENGGRVSSSTAYLGNDAGSSGSAVVTGQGSSWTNYGDLTLGRFGAGTLTVENGGTVTTKMLYASASDLRGNGTINTQGLIGDLDLVFDATHGANPILSFGMGGTLNLSLNSANPLGAGYHGTGSLRIADGVKISSSSGSLGYYAGSSGSAVVTGQGSSWTNSDTLYVGDNGAGTLRVENGGTVSSPAAILGCNSDDSSGNAVVTGQGSSWNSDTLRVCAGTLTVDNGGKVSNFNANIGCFGGSSGGGRAVVTGQGSSWTSSGILSVGSSGAGTLTVKNGGAVSSYGAVLGDDGSGPGNAVVTGQGSSWNNSLTLCVGYYGAGTLTIKNGGAVSSAGADIGFAVGSTGSAVVTGQGSNWTNSGPLYVRYGTLTVGNGGKVTAPELNMFYSTDSKTNVHVSGSGMIVLGTATSAGTVSNSGTVNLYADAFLASGTYSPITELKGRAMTWSGTGSYNTYGGTWDSSTHTFTVAAAAASGSGISNTLTTGERLLITDSATGHRVGASFGTVVAGTNFQADLVSGASLNSLAGAIPADQAVLGAWNFTTNFSGDQALLSFDVGAGQSYDMSIWHYNGIAWSAFAAPDLTYGDAGGIANFAVTSLGGGYAMTTRAHDGDANKDGAVNVVDLGVLAKYYDTAAGATWGMADFSGDGAVNVVDLGVLAKNYDWVGTSAGAVPEPCSMTLLALGGLALLRRRAM